jgi:predicted transcriptional regulator
MINNKFTVSMNESVENVISKILINKNKTVFVLKKNKILGTISDGDILRCLLTKKNLKSPAYKIMNKSFKYILMKKNIKQAQIIFKKFNIIILPVIKKNFELIDVITLKDVLDQTIYEKLD